MILTNNHVVDGAREIVVRFHDGRKLAAKIVGTDPKSDLAVLKVKATGLPVVEFGSSRDLRIGDVVLAIGNPFGVGQTVTAGIVSALGRNNVNITDYENFIQTDAAINPGNSGGALITSDGKLIGINTAILSRTGGSHGIGFAIPVSMALPIMERILEKGYVARGWLGVSIQEVDHDLRQQLKLKTSHGAVVAKVEPQSPAEKAGLRYGDVIIGVDGTKTRTVQALRHTIAMISPGTNVQLSVIRKGVKKTIRVSVGSLETRSSFASGTGTGDLGMFDSVRVKKLSARMKQRMRLIPKLEGVVVQSVDSRSIAGMSGLRRGDVILEINRKEISSAKDFQSLARNNRGPVALLILRDGQAFYLLISQDEE
jgi:Do/DeqQ family serine protease